MELFLLNDQLTQIQRALSEAQGEQCLRLQVELAWHLRERDSRTALGMAEELLRQPAPAVLHARAHLIRGETLRLLAELDAAYTAAMRSQQGFLEDGDLIGQSDACSLLAWIAMDRGDTHARDVQLENTAELALQAGDLIRADVAKATQARAAVFRDVQQALTRWGKQFATVDSGPPHLARNACIHDFLATAASQQSDFARAIEHWMQSHENSLASGQIRRAAVTATNIGNAFNRLNEHNTALEWMQRGLDLARPTEWPGTIGNCLMQTGETLRSLGRLDAAYDILREAQSTLSILPNSRNYAITLEYLGELMLDRGDYAAANSIFIEQQERADTLGQSDFQISAHRGRAHALSVLEQPQDALQQAQLGLELAQQHKDAYNEVLTLRVLANIHSHHTLAAPTDMQAQNSVLHYLLQALQVAKSIAGYNVPGDLYDALGREYARIGDFALAYSMALQASSSREITHSEGATNRAIAMQVRHQTERAQAEGEHHRQLAAEQEQRAEILLQTSTTLERLSSVGQDITTHLDAAAVFSALERHLHGLLEGCSLSVLLLEENGQELCLRFGNENGRPLPMVRIPLDHPFANSARCVREKREILIEKSNPQEGREAYLPGTNLNMTMLFGPLAVGERILGVMSVQSARIQAFGARERLIFRTLCAYGAIAFDNSATYLKLKATLQTLSETQDQLANAALLQTRLVEQKMAAEQLARQRAEEATQMKSAFLANMSHEIRTPMNAVIGLAHLALRTDLTAKQQDYLSKIHRAGMSLLGIINDILDFSKIEAGKLDIEQTPFSLDDVLANVSSVSSQRAADKGLEYLFRVPHAVPRFLIGDALRLGQVLINLVNNAIKFTENGEIELSIQVLQQTPQQVSLHFLVRDTGIGMNSEQVAQLFKPFTQADGSTSRKFGGTGLGLSISQHLVQLMGVQENAHITAESQPDHGSRFHFVLKFPLAQDINSKPELPCPLHGARVLVVDDNPIALEIFVDALSTLPLRVFACNSGVQALQTLRQAQLTNAPFQLVISDWQMPGMDGIALAQEIQADPQLCPPPKIILATAFGREEVQEQAEHAGVAGFLYKPVSEALLYSTLNSVFAPQSRMVVQSNIPQYQFGNCRVLLAEDNDINQQIAMELLANVGISCKVAQNGREAVHILQANPHAYALVLMDLEMPELDGHAATAEIRQDSRFDDLVIVAMTAHALPEIRERCLRNGMQDYLTKPIQPELLYSTLARWIKPLQTPAAPAAPTSAPLPAIQDTAETAEAAEAAASAAQFPLFICAPRGNQAGLDALEQLVALLHFNPAAGLEYFVNIESGLALLLDQQALAKLEQLLQAQEFEAAQKMLASMIAKGKECC